MRYQDEINEVKALLNRKDLEFPEDTKGYFKDLISDLEFYQTRHEENLVFDGTVPVSRGEYERLTKEQIL